MSKIIAVQKGLDIIANRLRDKGYKVIDLNGTNEPIDAIVYSEKRGYETAPMMNNLTIPANNQFVVMLNADELKQEEIINRIDNIRTY